MQIGIDLRYALGTALIVMRKQIFGVQRVEHSLFLALSIVDLPSIGSIVTQAGSSPRFDIAKCPETRDSGQVVSRGRNQCFSGILVTPLKTLVSMILLKVEQSVAQNAKARQCVADFVRHRAQVLTNDNALVAHTFER